jgi:hypothetical protein
LFIKDIFFAKYGKKEQKVGLNYNYFLKTVGTLK